MGIYVPGMEMPKDITLFSVSPDGTIDIVHGEGDLAWKTLKEKAVYVSPHGDLIDRNALLKEHYGRYGVIDEVAREAISKSPIIIPASKEE